MRIKRSLTVLDGHAVHKMWRGHNGENNLGTDEQKRMYLEFLNDDLESEEYEVGASLNAFTLMSNHAHEMFEVASQKLFSEHMRRHHGRYGLVFNKKNNRSGKVAEDRPKTVLIGDWHHEMLATFYVHANPLRANMVKDLRNYYWSTHRLYAFGVRDWFTRNVKLPEWYKALGRSPKQRQRNYRKAFERYLKEMGLGRQSILKGIYFGPEPLRHRIYESIKAWRKACREGKGPPKEK